MQQTINIILSDTVEDTTKDDLICDLRDEEPGMCLYTDFGLIASLNGNHLVVPAVDDSIMARVLQQIFHVMHLYDDSTRMIASIYFMEV